MKRIDTNTIIAIGLSVIGFVAVCGWIAISIHTGTSSGTEVPIAVISGLSGVLTGKSLAQAGQANEQSRPSQVLGQIADTAHAAQNVVDAVESIKDIVKK